MLSIRKSLNPRDGFCVQILQMQPWVEDLRDLMPKTISLPPYDAGVEGIILNLHFCTMYMTKTQV